jgi:hypothetical protein
MLEVVLYWCFHNLESRHTTTDVEKSIPRSMNWLCNQGFHVGIAGYEWGKEDHTMGDIIFELG